MRSVVAGGQLLAAGSEWAAPPHATPPRRRFWATSRPATSRYGAITTDANGGYIVSEPLHAQLIEKVRKVDPIFDRAHHFDLSGGNDTTMILPKKSAHGVASTATETGPRSEQTEPTFAGPTLSCFDYYTDQRASQQFLDSVPDAETMLLTWIYEDIFEQFGVDLACGTGSTSAIGLFSAVGVSTYATMLSGSAGALLNSNFRACFLKLPVKYRANACWIMSSLTLGILSGFADPASATTPLVDWSAADGAPRICGKPVYVASSAPEIGASAYPVFFGDLSSAMAIAEHSAVSTLRDPFTCTPLVRFYSLARLGSSPWDGEAGVLIKANNT